MTIRTSRNLDEIKPGGLELLTKRQMKYAIVTLLVTVVVTVVAVKVFGVNLTVAGYLGLIVAFPIGYIGFFKKNGMTLPEYRQAKKNINQSMLFYVSTENPEVPLQSGSQRLEEQTTGGIIE